MDQKTITKTFGKIMNILEEGGGTIIESLGLLEYVKQAILNPAQQDNKTTKKKGE